jgi:hypothetical protein
VSHAKASSHYTSDAGNSTGHPRIGAYFARQPFFYFLGFSIFFSFSARVVVHCSKSFEFGQQFF